MQQFIAIVGGSGSGKTWLAHRLKRMLGSQATILALDDFYRDLSDLPMRKRREVNFDHPGAIDWAQFLDCMEQIRTGKPTRLPRYDFSTHTRLPRPRAWKPRPVIIVEGLWLLHRPELRKIWSKSIFVDCVESLRLERRVERDRRERGRSLASIKRQFHDHVAPMHDCHVAPQASYADVVLQSPIASQAVKHLLASISGV